MGTPFDSSVYHEHNSEIDLVPFHLAEIEGAETVRPKDSKDTRYSYYFGMEESEYLRRSIILYHRSWLTMEDKICDKKKLSLHYQKKWSSRAL